MALFKVVVEAFVASRELDQASLSRLAFWTDALGEKEIAAISADDIDAALIRLAERGRLVAGKRVTTPSGKPLAGATVNRYLTQAGSVFKHARRLRLVPRTFVPPPAALNAPPSAPTPSGIFDQKKSSARSPWRGCSIANGARCLPLSPSPTTPGCAWGRS